eukprot:5476140-Prymnesium_polylepis.3
MAVRHAALARARLPRAAFDLAQCGAPADASLRARPRDALADAEGGGLQARPRQHERHGSLPGGRPPSSSLPHPPSPSLPPLGLHRVLKAPSLTWRAPA